MMGKNIDSSTLDILKRKCGGETFGELKRVHDMSEKERTEYFARLQQQQAALQQQQQQQTDAA